ncbi:MAG: hypothetical protein ABSA33_04065 [Candidatus Micrarchaeaceae archaeon]
MTNEIDNALQEISALADHNDDRDKSNLFLSRAVMFLSFIACIGLALALFSINELNQKTKAAILVEQEVSFRICVRQDELRATDDLQSSKAQLIQRERLVPLIDCSGDLVEHINDIIVPPNLSQAQTNEYLVFFKEHGCPPEIRHLALYPVCETYTTARPAG